MDWEAIIFALLGVIAILAIAVVDYIDYLKIKKIIEEFFNEEINNKEN